MTEDNVFEQPSTNVFRNRDVLTEDYTPEKILEREREKTAYRNAFIHVLDGDSPQNVFLYGKTGVGKSAVAHHMNVQLVEAMEAREDVQDVRVITCNCNEQSAYATVIQLINRLRGDGEPRFPSSGHSFNKALDVFYEEVDERDMIVLIVLDEVDHMRNPDALLYDLPRARSNERLTDSHIAIVGISNDYGFRKRLSPKTQDTLTEKEIHFQVYDSEEIFSILSARVEKAFYDGICPEEPLRYVSALVARETGSARQALDIVREAGDLLQQESGEVITDTHIDEGKELVERGRLLRRLQDQTIHARCVAEALADRELDNRGEASAKDIKPDYQQVVKKRYPNVDPVDSDRAIHDQLSELRMLGFLNSREVNTGRKGGRYFVYSLDIEPAGVRRACEEIATKEGW